MFSTFTGWNPCETAVRRVPARLQVGEGEAAVLVGASVEHETGAGVLQHEIGVGHHGAGRVADGADDLPGGPDLGVERKRGGQHVNVYNGRRDEGGAHAKQHGGPPPIASLSRIMKSKTIGFCIALAAGTCISSARLPLRADGQPGAPAITAESLSALSWRSIGPAMFAGRVVDVAGVPGRPEILYVGAASSGLYKSTNAGTTFESVFNDGGTLSIGAIAVQPDNPDVVYVGTGEGFVRNSISFGDGIYKTTDGGRTWKNLGLRQSERFSRIVIHPSNPQIVLAAAMGHAFGRNTERGIFRSADGGATWNRTLSVDDTTGASDVAVDPGNPDIVYAGMYDYQRQPWHFRSGGPGSGLYRSKDGGVTWTKLTDAALKNGLPGGKVLGRIGVAVARSDPSIVYALIESQETACSGDRAIAARRGRWSTTIAASTTGRSTTRRCGSIRWIPNRVYTMSGSFNVSTDGGRTFGEHPGGEHVRRSPRALDRSRPTPIGCSSGTDGGFFISQRSAAATGTS